MERPDLIPYIAYCLDDVMGGLSKMKTSFRSLMLDLLTACAIISSVALFTAGAVSGDERWVIVACGIAGLAVWLTESDSAL